MLPALPRGDPGSGTSFLGVSAPASCSQRQWKPVSCLSPRMTLGIRQKEGVSVTLLVVADGGSLPALSVGTMPTGKGVGIELEPGLEPGDRERWRGPLLPPSCPHSTHNPQTTCSNPDTYDSLIAACCVCIPQVHTPPPGHSIFSEVPCCALVPPTIPCVSKPGGARESEENNQNMKFKKSDCEFKNSGSRVGHT